LVVEERDEALRHYEREVEEKEGRIAELEEFLERKQGEFERRFEELQGVIGGR
jgi:phosphopantetheine adenylyltransferase